MTAKELSGNMMTGKHDNRSSTNKDFLAMTASPESQQKYEFLLELCNDGILIVQNGKIRESNHLMAKLCGYAVEEVLDTEFASFFHPDDMDRIERISARVIDDANSIEIHETALMCKNGIKIFTELTAGQFVYNQEPAVLFMVRDISERIQSENELEKGRKMASIAAFSGGIAHDYNNLLTAIIGNISLAQANLPPEHKAFVMLSEALTASNSAKNLTHQLTHFSKDNNTRKTTATVAELVTNAAEFTLSGSNLRPVYHFPAGLWPIEVERSQLVQALHNIVMNAREAMPRGGQLMVGAENITIQNEDMHLPKGKYVRIYFEDQGSGIQPVFLDNIFDPYFSTKNHRSREVPGLGLSISQTILKKHSGTLTVESEVGNGTTLFVYLPAGETSPVEKESEPGTETEIPIFGNGRILIMDDEEMIRELAGKIVTHLGYDVEFARDGSEAVNQYRKALEACTPYDAVILDLTVRAAMGGLETIQKLLELDPQVNAIVSSGYASQPDIMDFEQHGFKGFVAKPYTVEELRETLERVLPVAA
jgi:PAS domain S-box-containing protein